MKEERGNTRERESAREREGGQEATLLFIVQETPFVAINDGSQWFVIRMIFILGDPCPHTSKDSNVSFFFSPPAHKKHETHGTQ